MIIINDKRLNEVRKVIMYPAEPRSKTNMNRKKTIGYVSAANPFTDRKAWSGTIYKIREAIELSGYEVRWIPYKTDSISIIYQRVKLKLKRIIGGGQISFRCT